MIAGEGPSEALARLQRWLWALEGMFARAMARTQSLGVGVGDASDSHTHEVPTL